MNRLCRPYDRRAASTTASNPNIDLKPWPQTPFSLLLHKQYAISQYQHHQYMRAPAHVWASYTAVLSMSPGSEQTHVHCRLKVWLDCRQLCCPWSALWTLPVLQWPLCEWVQCACIVYCGFSQKNLSRLKANILQMTSNFYDISNFPSAKRRQQTSSLQWTVVIIMAVLFGIYHITQ